MRRSLLIVCILWGLSFPALALESPSADTGRILFDSQQLGQNGKSCSSCHPDGAGLAGIADMSDGELASTINICIEKPLAGQPLDPDSTEMASMILYLRQLYPAP